MIRMKVYSLMFLCFGLWLGASAEQCGRQVGGAVCPNGLCCSDFGWCGTTQAYCGNGCQSQCSGPTPPQPRPTPPLPPTPSGGDVGDIITEELFEEMLLHRNDQACPSHGFYTYDAFINASQSFSGFGTTGDETTRKRELAAFFGQTSHETSGGWPFAEDGPYAWGYCSVNELNPYGSYCMPNRRYPCARGKKYYGRGPMQLSYNYNYGLAGDALGLDLLGDPDLISEDPIIAFETAMWFWMTPQGNIPSIHDVMTGAWVPRIPDILGGRLPGYGLVTNIVNGGVECGHGYDYKVEDRIGFYKKYCDLLGIDYGDNLDCYYQRPFNWDVKSSYQM